MSGRGVKYWPAPFLPSLAAFSSRPSNAAPFTSTSIADQSSSSIMAMTRLRLTGLLKRGVACAKMSREQPAGFAELAQDVGVMIGERGAGLVLEAGPVAALRHVDAALVGHLEEEQIGELLDVVAVVHAVVAQRVAEAPEFLDDVGHAAMPR